MKNSFLNKLTPKEPKFFPLLKRLAEVSIKASELMVECLKDYNNENAIKYYKLIKQQEQEGDAICNKIFDKLNSTFITPFDREDIHHLANNLDNVTDGINSCAKRVALYRPESIPESAVQLAELVREGALGVLKAVEELEVLKKNSKNMTRYCKELDDLEHKGDDVYEQFIKHLFENEKDGIEIIKLKEVVYELEQTIDEQDRIGRLIRTMIIKYS